MSRSKRIFGLVAAFTLFASPALGQSKATRVTASIDQPTQSVMVTMEFDSKPTFASNADVLQMWFDPDRAITEMDVIRAIQQPGASDRMSMVSSLTTGGSSLLEVVQPMYVFGPVTNPHAGGWGSVLGSIPFSLSRKTLSFALPLAYTHITSEPFWYVFVTIHEGSYSFQSGQLVSGMLYDPVPILGAEPVPEAPTVLMLAIGLASGLLRHRCLLSRSIGANRSAPRSNL